MYTTKLNVGDLIMRCKALLPVVLSRLYLQEIHTPALWTQRELHTAGDEITMVKVPHLPAFLHICLREEITLALLISREQCIVGAMTLMVKALLHLVILCRFLQVWNTRVGCCCQERCSVGGQIILELICPIKLQHRPEFLLR